MSKLQITQAAILVRRGVDTEIWTLPRPARHHHIIRAMTHVTGDGTQGIQGFLDTEGLFCARELAARVAFAAGQIPEMKEQLFSEDLW